MLICDSEWSHTVAINYLAPLINVLCEMMKPQTQQLGH